MQYGLTETGFKAKDLATIRSDLRDKFTNRFGDQLNVGPDSVMGQIIDVMAATVAENWELAREVYRSFDRDNASGDALDNLGEFVPVSRKSAEETTGTIQLEGDPGVDVPSGLLVESDGGDQFSLDESLTLDSEGEGEGTVTALETGPKKAAAGTVTTIVTPVEGLDSVGNEDDFQEGREREADPDFRRRQANSLFVGGRTVDQAIKAELLELDAVDNAQILTNRTLTTDQWGTPGKSFQSILYPETEDPSTLRKIARVLFDNQAAGARAWGSSETMIIEDDEGFEQEVEWTWASPVDLEVNVDVSLKVGDYERENPDLEIIDALEEHINDLQPGEDVRYTELFETIVSEESAVEDFTIEIIKISSGTSVIDASLSLEFDEIAKVNTDDISVDLP